MDEFSSVGGPAANVLRTSDSGSHMKTGDSQLLLLKIEDRKKFEEMITYVYAGSDAAAVHKPISVYKERNANAYLVAGRYVGVSDTDLKYKQLSEEERKLVVEKLGTSTSIKFLSDGIPSA